MIMKRFCKECGGNCVTFQEGIEMGLAYYCSKCKNVIGEPRIHIMKSKIGRRHLKYKMKEEPEEEENVGGVPR